ncbi:MAG: ROK family protein [Gemmatimonadetes bacterium]|nr:ROK family protein [Gemmatimonadota bacterium]
MDRIVATLGPMLDAVAADGNAVSGIGVSVAGFLDPEHATMFGNANLPALCGFPLRRALEQRLALVCRLEVDSNAAVIAEYRHGAGRGSERLLGVTVGTGLGGGVVVDGKLLRYTGECAGDLGHIIVDPKGRLCTCGARGCLEAMVCAAAISDRAAGRVVRDVVSGAQRGEPLAGAALAETGWWLGLGLASLSSLFAPDRIVVGGGVAAAGDLLLEPARASYRMHASAEFREKVHIVGSSFDGWEGMIGAGSLFLDPLA